MDNNEQQPIINHTSEKLVNIDEVIPNPRNPNTHDEKQIKLLGKIIRFQGWRLPIVVSNLSGFIVRGHGRLETAKHLGLQQVPVSYQDYENEAQEWADLIADNRIAELAEIDRASLKDMIEQLDTGEIDLDVTGFDDNSLEKLMSEFHQDTESDDLSDNLGEYFALEIKCKNEQQQEKLYRELCAEGYECKILTL
jgi:ParB-like chromosome segregation protein Spo0J